MSYDAILFDCDGVIVELPSQETIIEALKRTHERIGHPCSPEQTAVDVVRGNLAAIGERCASVGIDREAFCKRAATDLVRAQRRELESGLRSLYSDVEVVRELEQPLGVVSDNHPRFLAFLLERFDLGSRFETVRGCSFTPRGFARRKPSPDNVVRAIADIEASNAVYVGDRPVDVRAATNAGIDSVLVCRDDSKEDRELTVTPTDTISSLRELPAVVS